MLIESSILQLASYRLRRPVSSRTAGRFRPALLGHQAELIGLTSLWAPTFAHTLMRQVNAGAHLDPGRVARYVPRPASGFASAHIAVLREIARRRGWQTSDIEELSFTELALRPIRRNGIPLDVIVTFATTGDPSAIVPSGASPTLSPA